MLVRPLEEITEAFKNSGIPFPAEEFKKIISLPDDEADSQFKAALEKFGREHKVEIANFRKKLLAERKQEISSGKKSATPLYRQLITLTKVSSVNDDVFDPIENEAVPVGKISDRDRIVTADGWIFDVNSLAREIHGANNWRHPVLGGAEFIEGKIKKNYEYDPADQEQIIKKAKEVVDLDLSKISDEAFLKNKSAQDDKIDNTAAIALAQQSLGNAPSDVKDEFEEFVEPQARFSVNDKRILDFAIKVARPPEFLVHFEMNNPQKFLLMEKLAPFIEIGKVRWTDAMNISEGEADRLEILLPFVQAKIITFNEARTFTTDLVVRLQEDMEALIAGGVELTHEKLKETLEEARPPEKAGGFMDQNEQKRLSKLTGGVDPVLISVYCLQDKNLKGKLVEYADALSNNPEIVKQLNKEILKFDDALFKKLDLLKKKKNIQTKYADVLKEHTELAKKLNVKDDKDLDAKVLNDIASQLETQQQIKKSIQQFSDITNIPVATLRGFAKQNPDSVHLLNPQKALKLVELGASKSPLLDSIGLKDILENPEALLKAPDKKTEKSPSKQPVSDQKSKPPVADQKNTQQIRSFSEITGIPIDKLTKFCNENPNNIKQLNDNNASTLMENGIVEAIINGAISIKDALPGASQNQPTFGSHVTGVPDEFLTDEEILGGFAPQSFGSAGDQKNIPKGPAYFDSKNQSSSNIKEISKKTRIPEKMLEGVDAKTLTENIEKKLKPAALLIINGVISTKEALALDASQLETIKFIGEAHMNNRDEIRAMLDIRTASQPKR